MVREATYNSYVGCTSEEAVATWEGGVTAVTTAEESPPVRGHEGLGEGKELGDGDGDGGAGSQSN